MVARNLPGGLRPGNPHNITLEGISGLTPAVLRVSADPDLKATPAAWAKPGVQLLCGEHDLAIPMVEQAPAPV